MKKALLIFSMLTLSLGAYAGDLSVVTQDSLNIFMKILPELRQIASAYQDNASANEIMANSYKYKDKIDKLLKQYGMTAQELTVLMQKVSYGIAMLEMEKQNISSDAFGLAGLQSISEEELAVIEENLPRLKAIFIGP